MESSSLLTSLSLINFPPKNVPPPSLFSRKMRNRSQGKRMKKPSFLLRENGSGAEVKWIDPSSSSSSFSSRGAFPTKRDGGLIPTMLKEDRSVHRGGKKNILGFFAPRTCAKSARSVGPPDKTFLLFRINGEREKEDVRTFAKKSLSPELMNTFRADFSPRNGKNYGFLVFPSWSFASIPSWQT